MLGQSLEGYLTDELKNPIVDAVILLENTPYQTKTDAKGYFQIANISTGTYTLLASHVGKEGIRKTIEIADKNLTINLLLKEKTSDLTAVELVGKGQASPTHLRSVEGFGIYEGKKTEVITIADLTANLSTNNPRQVFSQIVGLNIWESDGVGLQLGIGGRGLSPNRTSNFNTRQNGYDISADALGYPESYYTPPVEALERIEIVRGAASLQYGTQFGGMLNFKFKQGVKDKKTELTSRQSVGSWGYFGTFNSVGGTVGKFNYYAYHQYKTGAGYRPNSGFQYQNAYLSLQYKFSERFSASLDITKMHYLAQQAGGLTDRQFKENVRQSRRERNWFRVDWNLTCLQLTYQINENAKINSRTFGLVATREALGNLERIDREDEGLNRTLIAGKFQNIGNETRYLQNYSWAGKHMVFLAGVRLYRGITTARQDLADAGKGANFQFLNQTSWADFGYLKGVGISDYQFPNENYAAFIENIFNLTEKFSLTPGVRFEHIRTYSDGNYSRPLFDGANNLITENRIFENLQRVRSLFLVGLGASYRPSEIVELYANISQNYRAINFTDLRIQNPNFVVDQNIQDEKGYTADLGARGKWKNLQFEATVFYLAYAGRIGQVLRQNEPPLFNEYRFRTNIADARNIGFEFLGKWESKPENAPLGQGVFGIFVNFAWVDARYIRTDDTSLKNRRVEMVPPVMLRTGITYRLQNFSTTLQWAYIGKHFSDATNAISTATAVEGVIPAYQVGDFSVRYTWKMVTLEGSINNLLNTQYFTRRAEAYPGPGIIPSDGRGFYATVQVRI